MQTQKECKKKDKKKTERARARNRGPERSRNARKLEMFLGHSDAINSFIQWKWTSANAIFCVYLCDASAV